MAVVPIAQLGSQMPEHGRIRIGKRTTSSNGKTIPTKIPTFRFTSYDRAAIEAIAKLYGGVAQPWAGSPRGNEWEVITKETIIPVTLPPDPLVGTPIYEMWSGGGCERRCDGVTVPVFQQTPDGGEMVDQPCLCNAEGFLKCKPKTRLLVVLRDIRFGGTWRLESNGIYAARELPGMVGMIQQLQTRGLTAAMLTLMERTSTVRGKTKKWMTPGLMVDASIQALIAGEASLQSLGRTDGPQAIEAPVPRETIDALPLSDEHFDPDSEVVDDAEIVDEPDTTGEAPISPPALAEDDWGPEPDPTPTPQDAENERAKRQRQLHAVVSKLRAACDASVSVDDWRHALMFTASKGELESSAAASTELLITAIELANDLIEGRRRFNGISLKKIRMSARRT